MKRNIMVKRVNKTGRRQILQLVDKKPPVTVNKSSHKVVSHNSDSDDDSKKSPRECEPSVSSAVDKASSSAPIDSQVADFLKEIDALTVRPKEDEESSEAEAKPLVEDDELKKTDTDTSSAVANGSAKHEPATDGEPISDSTQSSAGLYCVWQECRDESTGYSYYWNIQTNEVTWECPSEYLEYLKFLNASTNVASASLPSTSAASKSVTKNKKKKEKAAKEGAIIPISYFGGSSSSDSSSDDEDINVPDSQIHQKRNLKPKSSVSQSSKPKTADKVKITSHQKEAAAIGPQLPPDFQFSDNVPLSPAQTNIAAKGNKLSKSSTKSVEFGPQLPPNYAVLVNEPSESNLDLETDVASESGIDSNSRSQVTSDMRDVNSDSVQGPQSSVNGLVDSSYKDLSWEESLVSMDEEFQASTQVQNPQCLNSCAEMPDSTTRKGAISPKGVCVESSEVNAAHGLRSVVSYNSYTDDEDEQEPACISSSASRQSVRTATPESSNNVKDTESNSIEFASSSSPKTSHKDVEHECFSSSDQVAKELLPESSESCQLNEAETNDCSLSPSANKMNASSLPSTSSIYPEEPGSSYATETVQCDHNDIIGSIFSAAQESGGKFGFGFDKSKQLELENNVFSGFGSESSNTTKHRSKKGRYSTVSFVKSDQMLDLNSLSKPSFYKLENKSHERKIATAKADKRIPEKEENNNSVISESIATAAECSASVKSDSLQDIKKDVKMDINKIVANVEAGLKNPTSLNTGASTSDKPKGGLVDVKSKESSKKVKKGAKRVKKEEVPETVDVDLDDIDQILNNILIEKQMADSKRLHVVNDASTSKESGEMKPKKHSVTEAECDVASKPAKKMKTEPEESSKNDTDMTSSIINLSSLLVDKLSFLVTNHSTMSSLTNLLLQIQIRHVDWQAGALQGKYFLDRLEEIHQYLLHYENSCVTGDWTCQWDRHNKRYFYVNGRTNHSQWTFPAEAVQTSHPAKNVWSNHLSENSSAFQSGGQFPLVSSSMCEERLHKNHANHAFLVNRGDENIQRAKQYSSPSLNWMSQSTVNQPPSPPPPPPGVDSPPPPPPKTPPPESPPPPPPDSTEIGEREIPDVDMDLEDSNSCDSASFAGESIHSPQFALFPIKQNIEECTSTRSPEHRMHILSTNAVSSSTSTSNAESAVIAKPPQPLSSLSSSSDVSVSSSFIIPSSSWLQSTSSASASVSQNVNYSVVNQDSLLSSGSHLSSTNRSSSSVESGKSVPFDPSVPSCSSTSQQSKQTNASAGSSTTGVKKEKKKTKLLAGLALKKKKIPSLVEKWQKIKKEQEKEEKVSDEARVSTSM